MKMHTIACLAGCTVDIYPDQGIIQAGGGGLNFALMFRRCLSNGIISIVGAVGKDDYGNIIRTALTNHGVFTDHLHTDAGATSSIHIRNKQNGEKIFEHYIPGVLQTTRPTPSDLAFLATQDALLLTMFEEIEQYTASVLQHKWKGLVVVDFRTLSNFSYKTDIVKKHIHAIDICFFGFDEKSHDLVKEIEKISSQHNKLCVITLGSKGSLAFYKGKTYQQNAVPITHIADTTGAGDAFTAAFLSEYLQTQNISAGLQKGALLAAEVIQKHGAS